MIKLYIVRHGQTDWNVQHILQGRVDTKLNNTGIMEAKKLASKIDLTEIDICICSPLQRAKQTAKILVNNKIKIIYDDLIQERSFGDLEGKKNSPDLMYLHWDYKLNDSSYHIESVCDCLLRAKKFLTKIKQKYPQKNILVVSHGSFMRALHYNIIGYDANTEFYSFTPQNTTIYEYILD